MDKRNEKVVTIIICIFLSFGLWLYISNVENLNRTVEIKNVNVVVENENVLSESKLALLPEQAFQVNLRIEGPTKKVYSISKEDFKLKVDLSEYALKSGTNNIPVQIIDYPDGINIKNTGNLTIKVNLESLEARDIDISSQINITFAEGISEIASEISPKKVTISGPKSLVDKVNKVIIEGNEYDISKNFSKEFLLKAIDTNGDIVEGIEFSSDKVTYSMEVKKEKQVPVKVNYQGSLPEGIDKLLEEQSIKNVTISGDVEEVDKIQEIETEPVYLTNITENLKITLNFIIPEKVDVVEGTASLELIYNVKDSNKITRTIEGIEIIYKDEDLEKYDYDYLEKTVDIQVMGTKEELEKINKDNIKIEASVKELNKEGSFPVEWKASFVKSDSDLSIINNKGIVNVKINLKE